MYLPSKAAALKVKELYQNGLPQPLLVLLPPCKVSNPSFEIIDYLTLSRR